MSEKTGEAAKKTNSVKIMTSKGVEKVNTENIAKTGTFTGINGVYVKIQYKGFREDTIIGPFASQESADSAENEINP